MNKANIAIMVFNAATQKHAHGECDYKLNIKYTTRCISRDPGYSIRSMNK